MASSKDRVVVPGSEPPPGIAAHVLGPVDPDERMSVTVTLRPRVTPPTDAEIEKMFMQPVKDRKYPSRETFATAHGADPDALKKVEDFARGHGLRVVQSDAAARRVVLEGRAADFAAAFAATLSRVRHAGGECRGLSSAVSVPSELAPVVESVLGLDETPAARPRS